MGSFGVVSDESVAILIDMSDSMQDHTKGLAELIKTFLTEQVCM